jgi:hypothetical protein
MLEHTGRRSGQARFACLEVVGRLKRAYLAFRPPLPWR